MDTPHRGSIFSSFSAAWRGIVYLLRTQRNIRIELAIGALAAGLGLWMRIGTAKGAILTLTIALVLCLEAMNTAIERAVDLASPEIHPLAKAAKDTAAGAVLLAALASVIAGLLILGPALWNKLTF